LGESCHHPCFEKYAFQDLVGQPIQMQGIVGVRYMRGQPLVRQIAAIM
jgi:hypothetical protein